METQFMKIPHIHNDQDTLEELYQNHLDREKEIEDLLAEIRNCLSLCPESRGLNRMNQRISEIRKKDIKDLTELQKIIKKHNSLCCGIGGISSYNSCSCILRLVGGMAVVMGIFELFFSNFGNQANPTQPSVLTIVTYSTMALTLLLCLGETINCLGTRAIQEIMKDRNFTWEEKGELKALIKFFKELDDLHNIEDPDMVDMRFSNLKGRAKQLPKQYNGVQIFKCNEEILSFLLNSLPKNHPIRKRLIELENYVAKRPISSEDSSSQREDAEDGSSSFPEPDIDTIPQSFEEGFDYGSFRDYCIDHIAQGHSFEGRLASLKPGEPPHLSEEDEEYIQKKFFLCKAWVETEDFVKEDEIRVLKVNGVKIERSKIFREMDYKTFKSKIRPSSSSLEMSSYASSSEEREDFDLEEGQSKEEMGWRRKLSALF